MHSSFSIQTRIIYHYTNVYSSFSIKTRIISLYYIVYKDAKYHRTIVYCRLNITIYVYSSFSIKTRIISLYYTVLPVLYTNMHYITIPTIVYSSFSIQTRLILLKFNRDFAIILSHICWLLKEPVLKILKRYINFLAIF